MTTIQCQTVGQGVKNPPDTLAPRLPTCRKTINTRYASQDPRLEWYNISAYPLFNQMSSQKGRLA